MVAGHIAERSKLLLPTASSSPNPWLALIFFVRDLLVTFLPSCPFSFFFFFFHDYLTVQFTFDVFIE